MPDENHMWMSHVYRYNNLSNKYNINLLGKGWPTLEHPEVKQKYNFDFIMLKKKNDAWTVLLKT